MILYLPHLLNLKVNSWRWQMILWIVICSLEGIYYFLDKFCTILLKFIVFRAKPNKTDWEVLKAIPDIIDLEQYPNIYRWRHEMLMIDQTERGELR